jgi:POT family proton-dependent oligopeptide transporter
MGFIQKVKEFQRSFWAANTMELFERWAFYGVFLVIALYLTGSKETGALEFSQTQKGFIMGIVTAILYFLPLFTGAIADSIGYKKSLLASQIILATGYTSMGFFTSFSGVFIAFLYIAIGAALFKPIIAATITKTTTTDNSTIGFGIYYMIINIGAFIGPLIASKLRQHNWQLVFIGSALAILVNIIILLFFYKEPAREPNKELLRQKIKSIFVNSFHVFSDLKLILLLLIIVGFWSVYWQLFFTIPSFIDQWVNTRPAFDFLLNLSPWMASVLGFANGTIPPEIIINIDAALIILFQIVVSVYSGKLKPLHGILAGMLVNTTGMFLAFLTGNVWLVMLSVAIAAFGEMLTSPRIIEYLGRIAPEGRTAAYIGSSFIPMSLGNIIAGFLSGSVYEKMSDKFTLMRTEFAMRFPDLTSPTGNTELVRVFTNKMGLSESQIDTLLWVKYQPQNIAFIFLSIGMVTAVLLILYNVFIVKSEKHILK